jgi:hypothetical protein
MAASSSGREGSGKVTTTLDQLIVEHQEALVDRIVKDAILQIPSYQEAPLRQTMDRIDQALRVVADSIKKNDPDIIEAHLMAVADERQSERYTIGELHAVVQIIERQVSDLIRAACSDETECTALLALLEAVMDAAQMVLSVRYLLSSGRTPSS